MALQGLQHPEAGPDPGAALRCRPVKGLAEGLRPLGAAAGGTPTHGLPNLRDRRAGPAAARTGGRLQVDDSRVHGDSRSHDSTTACESAGAGQAVRGRPAHAPKRHLLSKACRYGNTAVTSTHLSECPCPAGRSTRRRLRSLPGRHPHLRRGPPHGDPTLLIRRRLARCSQFASRCNRAAQARWGLLGPNLAISRRRSVMSRAPRIRISHLRISMGSSCGPPRWPILERVPPTTSSADLRRRGTAAHGTRSTGPQGADPRPPREGPGRVADPSSPQGRNGERKPKIDPLLVSRTPCIRSSAASEGKGHGTMPDPNPSGKTIRHQSGGGE